ncbi:hypothetical protein [Pseudomonas protegens]|uniref:hypothetical protein n=1 Tax=Pseudomonas protegens TaxID=380021 RepID=UPI0022828B96|nr:hypothetical protein [Pseudomonas protegens]MCY7264281.1 hypothetical protein [Pseudomonas protegens]
MFGFIADKAKALSDAVSETMVSAGEAVVSAKDTVVESVGEGASAAVSQVEKHWPAVERILVDGLITVAHDRLRDDEVFLLAVEKAFELLPTPIRLVLPRSSFIKHSMAHRDSLVMKIEAQRAARLLLESSKPAESEK